MQTSCLKPVTGFVYIRHVFLLVSYGTFDWQADVLAAIAATIAMRIMYLPPIHRQLRIHVQYYQSRLVVPKYS